MDSRATPLPPEPSVWQRLWHFFSLFLLLGGLWAGGRLLWQREPIYFPVRVIRLEGEVRHLSLPALQSRISSRLSGGILTQDLAQLRAGVEALPWVKRAGIRRVWPDRLVIWIEERKPVAYWGEDGLVTASGVVFRPKSDAQPEDLPRLWGEEDQAPMIVERFLRWQESLAQQKLQLVKLVRSAQGGWMLYLNDGLPLYLGTSDLEGRLQRFLIAYPAIEAAGRPARIDARYSNGLAVRWYTGEQD